MDINRFAEIYAATNSKRHWRTSFWKDQQLVDLGMGHKDIENVAKVKAKIREGTI